MYVKEVLPSKLTTKDHQTVGGNLELSTVVRIGVWGMVEDLVSKERWM